jgi:DNA-directed RNA polymerase specialized sigma24 family protein
MERLSIGLFCLDDDAQEIIRLHYYEGYTCRQIGEQKQVSFKQAALLINSALTRLRTILNELNA